MKKKNIILTVIFLVLPSVFLLSSHPVMAQITNPVLSEELGGQQAEARAGITFVRYFVSMWRAIITAGAVIVLVYFLWAGIEWITAGGDAGKVGKARDKMTQSIIGLVILVSSTVIVGFISRLFFGASFNILQPTFPENIKIDTAGLAPAVKP